MSSRPHRLEHLYAGMTKEDANDEAGRTRWQKAQKKRNLFFVGPVFIFFSMGSAGRDLWGRSRVRSSSLSSLPALSSYV